jgi:hypothetical protein
MDRQIEADVRHAAKIYLTWRGIYSREVVPRRVRNTGCRPLLNVTQEQVVESLVRR